MKIVVLCGGASTEREISIVSGTGVCKALRSRGHAAILVDAFFGQNSVDLMDAFPEEYDVEEAAAEIRENDEDLDSAVKNPGRSFFGPNVTKLCKMADIVFMALHGENGENGKVQAAFDLRKIRYTGTGYLGSALSMDKSLTKTILASHRLAVPMGYTLERSQAVEYPSDHHMNYPCVVKVCCGGSSVGVYIAHDQKEFEEDLKQAFALEDQVIIEEYIQGREFSVGVIDGESLPVIEIAPKEGFYDYKNKYTAGSTVETCPAELSSDATNTMRRMAEKAYEVLQMEAYGRIDFLMRENGEIFCLEANTLPGMTPTSLLPQEAQAIGVDFPHLCEELIKVSMKKYESPLRVM